MRGMGTQRPEGVTVQRIWWLDDDGGAFTFRDHLTGQMQQHWRLDVTAGQQLGAVRSGGEGQLITRNPATGAAGVELRRRHIDLEGIGRMDYQATLPAVGWQTDTQSLSVTLSLPPGWRMLALWGADRVEGDWLTAWTLLDLFLVLVFAIAVGKLWSWRAGLVALLAFALTYHELGSPRYTWLMLLMPLALLRVVPSGRLHKLVTVWKWIAIACLLLNLVPFVTRQANMVLYPQLETPGIQYAPRWGWWRPGSWATSGSAHYDTGSAFDSEAWYDSASMPASAERQSATARLSRAVMLDPQAKIQTGPAQPDRLWNEVHCSWNGPVSPDQQIRPIVLTQPLIAS